MREITTHIVNPVNDLIKITVTDEPGAGGANHKYEVALPDGTITEINFQNGPIKEVGLNGITQEALLAIVIDRLRSFQAGPYPCNENALAMDLCKNALIVLQLRTRERLARGVEGQTKP